VVIERLKSLPRRKQGKRTGDRRRYSQTVLLLSGARLGVLSSWHVAWRGTARPSSSKHFGDTYRQRTIIDMYQGYSVYCSLPFLQQTRSWRTHGELASATEAGPRRYWLTIAARAATGVALPTSPRPWSNLARQPTLCPCVLRDIEGGSGIVDAGQYIGIATADAV